MEPNNLTEINNICGCLLIQSYKESVDEPEYMAINSESTTKAYLDLRWQYANEIIRIIKDLELTIYLMEYEYPVESVITKSFPKENIIIFYQGVFLDLIHQLKHRIIQLVQFLNFTPPPKEEFLDQDFKKQKGKIQDLTIKALTSTLKEDALIKILNIWDEDDLSSNNGIKVVLHKRTKYHHFISPLNYSREYTKIHGLRILENYKQYLSEAGKQYIKEETDKLSSEYSELSLKKCIETMDLVYENIKQISQYYLQVNNWNYDPSMQFDLIMKESEIKSAFTIKNTTSKSLISSKISDFLNIALELLKAHFGENLLTVYLVGSLGRGEFEPAKSDINLYVITNNSYKIDDESMELLKEIKNDIRFVTKEKFFLPINKKIRFICLFDGIVLFGNQLITNETFPNSGTELAYLMNKDLLEKIIILRKWCDDKSIEKNIINISEKARWIANEILHYFYGICDANHPGDYTFSKKKRMEKLLKYNPENKKPFETISELTHSNIRTLGELLMILDAYQPKVEKNIKKMEEIVESINKRKEWNV